MACGKLRKYLMLWWKNECEGIYGFLEKLTLFTLVVNF